MKHEDLSKYKGLAYYILPEGILEYFDVVDFDETPVNVKNVLYDKELHIYLDEHDNRTPDMADAIGHGYLPEKKILDFPIRDHKTVIHVRRQRWLMPDGTTRTIDLDEKIQIGFPGTRYSKEFALFLKGANG